MGQSSLPKRVLGTIEFIRAGGIPLPIQHKMISSQKCVSLEPNIDSNTFPGQQVDLEIHKSGRWMAPTSALGIEKPTEFQTEPRGSSYGKTHVGAERERERERDIWCKSQAFLKHEPHFPGANSSFAEAKPSFSEATPSFSGVWPLF